MRNFSEKMLLMNKAGEGGAGGKPMPPPPKPGEQEPPKEDPAAAAPKGDTDDLDELGYKKVAPEADKEKGASGKEGDLPPKTASEKPEKVENPGTGYGDAPPEDGEPPAADPPKEPSTPPTDLEKKLEGLHPALADRTKKQIAELGLEGDKLDKFIALKQQEQKDANEWAKQQEQKEAREAAARKKAWDKELRDDPTFGGDKFAVNLTRSEKILDEYGGELKKELTDAKQMLRPSVMRMLSRLADAVYPDRTLVQGDPPPPEKNAKDDKKGTDPLAFYE